MHGVHVHGVHVHGVHVHRVHVHGVHVQRVVRRNMTLFARKGSNTDVSVEDEREEGRRLTGLSTFRWVFGLTAVPSANCARTHLGKWCSGMVVVVVVVAVVVVVVVAVRASDPSAHPTHLLHGHQAHAYSCSKHVRCVKGPVRPGEK